MSGQPRVVVAAAHEWNHRAFSAWAGRTRCDARLIKAPEDLTVEMLKAWAPRYVFFAHWSWRIPAAIHEPFECVLFHMTDLPYGRGGSPLQNLIVRGHRDTMLTAIRVVDALDAGPVYLKRPLSLEGSAMEIFERCARLVFEMVDEIVATQPEPRPQEGGVVSFRRRSPKESRIPADADLAVVYDYIRMLDAEGYPAAFVEAGSHRIEFQDAVREGTAVTARVRITMRSEQGAQRE